MRRAFEWWKQHQSRIFRWYHGISVIVWLVMIPVAFITGWAKSVAFVTILSLWALVATEWGAFQAAGAEVKAEAQVEVSENGVKGETRVEEKRT